MASKPADMRAALVPLMLDLANLSTLPTPVSDDELLARVVVATCSLVQTARNPSRPQAFLDALDHAGSEGDSFFALIQEIASSRQQKQAAASVPELLLAPTHVPEAVKTDDLEKVPEAVELKNPDHNSSSNGTEKTVKSNGSEENGGKDIVQPTAVPINSPPVVTRNSAIALAKEENSSLNVPHAKARALSSKRTAYSVGDLLCLLNGAINSSTQEVAQKQLSIGGNSCLDITEYSRMMQQVVGQELKSQELRGLFNVMENSHDELTVSDFLEFFKLRRDDAMRPLTRVSVKVGNTVTSVAISVDQRFIAFGSMDCAVRIFNRLTGRSVYERKFSSQVSAVALSSDGRHVGVGCFGGSVQWHEVAKAVKHVWEHGKHINALAVSSDDTELAAAGDDCAVTLYSLQTGNVRYVFAALASVHSVSLAQKKKLKVKLADGTLLNNLVDVEVCDEEEFMKLQNNQKETISPVEKGKGFRRSTVLPQGADAFRFRKLTDPPKESISSTQGPLKIKGTIRSVSDIHGAVTVWTAMFLALDSVFWTIAMLIVVIAGTVLSLLMIFNPNKYNTSLARQLTDLTTYMFGLEVIVRMYSHWRVKGTLRLFLRNQYCLLDLLCSSIDLVLEIIFSVGDGGPLEDVPVSSIRLIRMLRLVRLLKAGRVIERVQERVAAKDRRPLYFDITLHNGHELKRIHRSLLVALDAKAMVELMDKQAKSTSRGLLVEEEEGSDGKFVNNSTVGVDKGGDNHEPTSVTRQFSKIMRRSQTAPRQVSTAGKGPQLSKTWQHLQVGTPVEMMVLDAQVLETELCKLVAFGGDTQRAIVYQYDVVAQSDSDLKQLALYELTGGSVARLGSPKVVHDDDAKQTPRSVSIKPSADADGSSPPGEVARRLSFHALLAWATGDVHEAGDGPSGPQEPSIVRMRMPKITEPVEVTRKARVVNVGGFSVDSHTDSDAKMPDDRDGADEEPRKNMMVAKLIFRKEYLQTLSSVSLSGNTQRLAVGDARGAVRVHEFSTDSEVFSWNDANQVFGVSLSYSGQHLATCGAAKSTRIFDVESGAETYHRVARDRLRAVALSHSGKVCVIGGFDGTVHACDIQAGARIQTFEQHEIVRSVATDASGLILAVGCDDGRCSLYDLGVPGADITTPPRWAALHDSKVWVVDVSRDGRLVAAGDYANVVRVYSADDGTPVWEKNSWLGKGAPFTWGLSFSGDSSTLAIGHWDSYAYIVDTETWTELAQLKRGDRVYSVSLDHEGKHLAVGGRDKVAAVYDIQRVSSTNGLRPNRHSANVFVANIHKASTNVKTTATINVGAFIYAVSLSNDGRRLAVGTVDNMVGLYLVGSQELLHSMRHQGSIQSVAFSPDANYLAVGGEQNAVTVWSLSEDKGVAPRQYLVLPRSSSVHSVAFSDVGLAFGSGSLATVYGGHQDAEWTDRPSFEVIADIMEHPNALTRLIEQHPTVLHLTNPMGGESLLQHTVRKRPASKVEMLLKTGCRFGLIEDARGHTALMIALKNERKPIVRMLLHSIAVSSRDQSTALKQFMRHREEIADKYPDLFLEFIQNIDLVVEDELAPQGQNIALLKSAADIITAGSEELRPIRLWDDLMELPASVSGKPSGRGQNTQRRHSILSSDPTRQRQSNKDLEVKIIPEGCKKVEVTAIRVPLEGVVSQTLEHIAQPQRTLLFLISHAAGELDDYHIFNTLLVRAMLQYKWHSYAQFVFVLQFYGFLVLLACTCLSAYALPRLCLASTCMDAAKICSLCIEADEGDGSCDHFPRLAYSGSFLRYDPDDDPDRSISTLWNTAFGRMAFLTLVASQLGCLFGISLEFRQLLIDGRKEYLGNDEVFKYLDLLAYGVELIVGALFFRGASIAAVLPVSSWAVLLMCFKTLSFARGFSSWGPLVRMIYKIMIDIRHFIMVMAVLIMAFAMSFIALGDGMIVSLFWVINTGMFDLTPPDQFDTSKETYSDTVTHVKIVFLILMGMVALILLNLLIAIMNSTYEEVRRVAALEVAYEKSRIILDIERFMLPVFMDLFHIEIELMFPRWLHILLPFTMIDAEHRRKQRREAQSEEHNENDDSKKEKSA